jgi:hypothetical protein
MGIVHYFKTTMKTNMKLKMWPSVWYLSLHIDIAISGEARKFELVMTTLQKNLQKIKQGKLGNMFLCFLWKLALCQHIRATRFVQMKSVRGFFWAEGTEVVKLFPMGLGVGVPLTNQFMNPVSGPLLEPLHYHDFHICLRDQATAL